MRYVVTITREGAVHAHTEDVVGPRCLDAIPLLEDLLEATVVDSAYRPEFHQTAMAAEQQETQQRNRHTATEEA